MDFFYVAIIACLVVHVECLQCFTCHNHNNLNECNSTVQCGADQACYQDKQGNIFSLGCIPNQQCGRIPSVGVVGRDADIAQGVKHNRQTDHCMECCGKELCNKHLCGHLKPTACIDDATVDCARLNTLVNLCQDIHHAKTICPKFCKLCTLVDVNWSPWSEWTSCDVTCADGTVTRKRTCTNPAPQNRGLDCSGQNTESKPCHKEQCPVHGGWSSWSSWGSCSETCGVGMQRKDRSCSNPYPARFGDHCYGDTASYKICVTNPCAGGAWSTWNAWTSCSVSCGGGLQTRSRACTNPQPSFFDLPCIGDTLQVQSCNDKRCPPLISAFSVGHPIAVQNGILGSFQTSVFNEGANFNSSSGIFTCKIPGVYRFAATLVKASSNDEMHCGFLKNNERINSDSYWYLFLSNSNDQYAAVTLETLVRQVNGDQMQLGRCTDGRTIQEWSTFHGYLLYPDV